MTTPVPRTGFVLVAAGSGTRLGAGMPKALVEVGGRTLLEYSIRALGGFPGRVAISVAAPPTHLEEATAIARAAAGASGFADAPLAVIAGGASRQASVASALDALPDDCDVVLVHDAARAFAPRSLAERVAGAVRATGEGVVPVLPVVDTIKRLDGERVLETVDRDTLGAAQTPQGFPAPALRRAYADAMTEHTDDAALAAAAGMRVRTVEGDAAAFKVTRPDDLERAVRAAGAGAFGAGASVAGVNRPVVESAGNGHELVTTPDRIDQSTGTDPASDHASDAPSDHATDAATDPAARIGPGHPDQSPSARSASSPDTRSRELRIGIGTDVHAFDDAAPLHLACLHWPGEPGLAGHSDGDAVAHAITDALLSAAGLGDIGAMFGTDDPELDGAAGEVFLRRTRERLDAAGMRIGNVAVQFVAQRPRFAPRRDEARAALERILGAPVSISATTSDGLGFTGRREGVLAIATALVEVPGP